MLFRGSVVGAGLTVTSIPMFQYVLRPPEEFLLPSLGFFERLEASLDWTQTFCDHMGFCRPEQSRSRRGGLFAHIPPRGALLHGLSGG
jgi:hypothetical protein